MIKQICFAALLTLAARAELSTTNFLSMQSSPVYLAWNDAGWTNDLIEFRLYFKPAPPLTNSAPLPPMPPGMTITNPPPKLDGSEIIWATFTPENWTRWPDSTNFVARIPSDLPLGTNLLCLTAVEAGIQSDPSNTIAIRVLKQTGAPVGYAGDLTLTMYEEFHVIKFRGILRHAPALGGPSVEVKSTNGVYFAKPDETGFWFNPEVLPLTPPGE